MVGAVGLTPIDFPPEGIATIAIYRKGLVMSFDETETENMYFDYFDSTDYQIAGIALQSTQDPTYPPLTKHSALTGKKIAVQRFGYADVTCAEDNLQIDVGEVVGAEADAAGYTSNADEGATLTVAVVDEICGGTGITKLAADPSGTQVHALMDELATSVGVALEYAAANYGVYSSSDPEARREIMTAMWLLPNFILTNS